MVVDYKRAIEFHRLAAGALSAASDKHLLAADALDARDFEKAKLLAAEARQAGHEAEVKSVSAAEASAAPQGLPAGYFVEQPAPPLPEIKPSTAPWSLEGTPPIQEELPKAPRVG